jgi:hypothetical protein
MFVKLYDSYLINHLLISIELINDMNKFFKLNVLSEYKIFALNIDDILYATVLFMIEIILDSAKQDL